MVIREVIRTEAISTPNFQAATFHDLRLAVREVPTGAIELKLKTDDLNRLLPATRKDFIKVLVAEARGLNIVFASFVK